MRTRACCAALLALLIQSQDDGSAHVFFDYSGGEIMASPASVFLGSDFDVRRFVHRAVWIDSEQRIEMRLRSACGQVAHLRGHAIPFGRDEELVTEYCQKYLSDQFEAMGRAAALRPKEQWTDPQSGFSVQLLEPDEADKCRPLEVQDDAQAVGRSGCRIAF